MRMHAELLKEFILSLSGKAETTVDAYQRELRHFLNWISQRAGNSGPFDAQQQLTKTALQSYLTHLQSEGHSVSHCARVKSAVGGFARWLIEEKQLLRRNPARGVELPPQPLLAPRELSADQRYVLRSLVERQEDARGEAIFALGYWAGCRISDVAWLRIDLDPARRSQPARVRATIVYCALSGHISQRSHGCSSRRRETSRCAIIRYRSSLSEALLGPAGLAS
jgi:site-specific recombinase XerC